MNKPLVKHTNDELRSRINKGQSLLDPAHKLMFAAWTNEAIHSTGRTVSKFTKLDLVAAFGKTAELYKLQHAVNVTEQFDTRTLSLRERTLRHAAQMRQLMSTAKEEALRTGKAVQIKLGSLKS